MPVGDLTRQLGISAQTFYRWKKLYSGLQPDQAARAQAVAGRERATESSLPS